MKKIISFITIFSFIFGIFPIQFFYVSGTYAYTSSVNLQDPETAPVGYIVNIPDEKLKAVLNEIIARQTGTTRTPTQNITAGELGAPNMKNFNNINTLKEKGITNLEGIQFLTKAEIIHLDNSSTNVENKNIISNLEPLKGLKKLTDLRLSFNNISDITPLSNITSLKELHLTSNSAISDISALSSLVNLEALFMSHLPNTGTIEPLKNLNKLRNLQFSSNNITDLSPIQGKTTIEYLYINTNKFTNFNVLSTLTNLKNLEISNTGIKDITVLTPLKQLQHLSLWFNDQITDFSTLAGLTSLKYLNIQKTNFKDSDIVHIANLPELGELRIRENQLSDLSALANYSFAINSTFNSQKKTIDSLTNIIPNPVKNIKGAIIPVVDTNDIENVDSLGNLDQNGGYLKIKKIGKSQTTWTTGNEKDFSGELTINYIDKTGPDLKTPTATLNPDTEVITFTIPEATDPSGVAKYTYSIQECDADGTNCTTVVGTTEIPFQAGNEIIEYSNPKKDKNRRYILKVQAEDTLGNKSPEQTSTIDTEIQEIEFQTGTNGTINTTTSQKVFNNAPFSKITLPTPTPNPGYKFKNWTDTNGNTSPTNITTPITSSITYTANFEVDQDQKIWNYTVHYYLENTTTPVPGITKNEDTGNAYIGKTITITPPVAPTGYKLVENQTTSFEVNQNNTIKSIYYKVDDSQKFNYTINYTKAGNVIETVTKSVLKANPTVNAIDIEDKTPKGYKLDTANSTNFPHTISSDNENITVSYIVDTSDAGKVFDYEISYLEEGTTTEVHPKTTGKGYIGEVIPVVHTPKSGYVISPNQATILTLLEQDTPTVISILYKKDSDNDGIADNIDNDDDNDGVSDEEENKYNSDPKDPNSKPNSYNFEPIVKNLLKKASDLKLTEEDIKNSILNKNTFPNGTNIIIDPKNNISDLQNTSGEKNIELTIVYPDGSFDKIIVKLTVELGSSPSKGSLIIKEDKRVNKGIKEKVEEEKEKGTNEELNKEEIKEETNTINKEKIVNGEIKRYSLSNRYLGCPMIPNIVGDYNKDFKISFVDIKEVRNIDELQRLTKTEVINPGGVNNTGLFEGKRGLTRAEFLAIVLKVHCYDVSKKAEKKRYKDVDLESWQSRVIEVSDKIGITRGYGDGSFRPNAEISKIEAFGIMMKMADIKIKDNYTDRYKDKKADWQTIPLSSGEYLGILKPEETNYIFNPNGKLSRDEMVKLIVDIVRLY